MYSFRYDSCQSNHSHFSAKNRLFNSKISRFFLYRVLNTMQTGLSVSTTTGFSCKLPFSFLLKHTMVSVTSLAAATHSPSGLTVKNLGCSPPVLMFCIQLIRPVSASRWYTLTLSCLRFDTYRVFPSASISIALAQPSPA